MLEIGVKARLSVLRTRRRSAWSAKIKRIRAFAAAIGMVPGVGFEPTRSCERRILSPLRLPFRHPGACA